MAEHHFLIEKYVEDGMTHTGVRRLNGKEQTEELARILSGNSNFRIEATLPLGVRKIAECLFVMKEEL